MLPSGRPLKDDMVNGPAAGKMFEARREKTFPVRGMLVPGMKKSFNVQLVFPGQLVAF